MSDATLECCHCHKVGDITMFKDDNFDIADILIRQAAKLGTLWCTECSARMERLLGIRR